MHSEKWSLINGVPISAGEPEFIKAWQSILEQVGDGVHTGEMAVLEVMRDAGALQIGALDPAWGGGWQWDMSSGAAKSVLTSALLYGVLVAAGIPTLLPIVVPTIMPLLFEIQRVRLTRSEKGIINIIGARKDALSRRGTSARLYKSLPIDVRASLGPHEFEQFIEAAINAGVASQYGEIIEVLESGENVFRLRIT
jgi:hypothetical protein